LIFEFSGAHYLQAMRVREGAVIASWAANKTVHIRRRIKFIARHRTDPEVLTALHKSVGLNF
jgi:hypothetical protein